MEKQVGTGAFSKGCAMEKYLPTERIPGPDGQMYDKEEFLQKVKEKETGGMDGNVRFEMMDKIAGRIGKKDSFLPLLDQLHGHYTQVKLKKSIPNKLKAIKEIANT